MKLSRTLPCLLAAFALLLALGGCSGGAPAGGSSSSPPPRPVPEGWSGHLSHSAYYEVPSHWEQIEAGHDGYYFFPPDGGMLMVMPASWGRSDLSTEEGLGEAVEYLLTLMDKNIESFKKVETTYAELNGYPAYRTSFLTAGAEGQLPGILWIVGLDGHDEVCQFAFVLPESKESELSQAMDGILASVGS